MIRQHKAAAGRARNAAEKTAGFWTQGARTVTDLVPGLPRVDLVPAVERYFNLVQRTVDINRRLAVRCAEVVGTLSGAGRKKAELAALEQAEAEQADKELARQARQAGREQARRAHARTRERYEGLTKAELGGLLAKRELPKTGNVDALIERLVEADSK